MGYIDDLQEIKPFLVNADFIDVKTVEGRTSMRGFIASMLSYYPWWIVRLYRVREIIVKMLGLTKIEEPDELPNLSEAEVPLTPGENASFFIVKSARDEVYWVSETPDDKHLRAYFGVAVEPLGEGLKRFHIITVVQYKHWTGPLYFNLIRPFHHLVVWSMARAGVKDNGFA